MGSGYHTLPFYFHVHNTRLILDMYQLRSLGRLHSYPSGGQASSCLCVFALAATCPWNVLPSGLAGTYSTTRAQLNVSTSKKLLTTCTPPGPPCLQILSLPLPLYFLSPSGAGFQQRSVPGGTGRSLGGHGRSQGVFPPPLCPR